MLFLCWPCRLEEHDTYRCHSYTAAEQNARSNGLSCTSGAARVGVRSASCRGAGTLPAGWHGDRRDRGQRTVRITSGRMHPPEVPVTCANPAVNGASPYGNKQPVCRRTVDRRFAEKAATRKLPRSAPFTK